MTLLKGNKQKPIMEIGLFPLVGQYLSEAAQFTSNGFYKLHIFLFGPRNRSLMSGNDNIYLKITVLTVFVSLFLASVSFSGSYTAGVAYAEKHGIASKVAAWIPISIDGMIVLLGLIRLGGSFIGTSEKWVLFLMGVFTGVSVLFNVSHIVEIGEATFENYLLGGVFPIVVLLATEGTAIQITNYIKRKTKLKSNQELENEYIDLVNRNGKLKDEIDIEYQSMIIDVKEKVKSKEMSELQPILDQVAAAKDELARLMAQSESESKKEGAFTQDDIKTAFMIGQDKNITGKAIAEMIGKSGAHGNALKRKIKPVLNGELEKSR